MFVCIIVGTENTPGVVIPQNVGLTTRIPATNLASEVELTKPHMPSRDNALQAFYTASNDMYQFNTNADGPGEAFCQRKQHE